MRRRRLRQRIVILFIKQSRNGRREIITCGALRVPACVLLDVDSPVLQWKLRSLRLVKSFITSWVLTINYSFSLAIFVKIQTKLRPLPDWVVVRPYDRGDFLSLFLVLPLRLDSCYFAKLLVHSNRVTKSLGLIRLVVVRMLVLRILARIETTKLLLISKLFLRTQFGLQSWLL